MNDRGAEDDSRAGAVFQSQFQFQMQCLRSTALDTRSLDGREADRAKCEAVRVPDISNAVPRQGPGQELKRVNRMEVAESRGTEGPREKEDSKRRVVFPEELVFLLRVRGSLT
jgi:hypothetical protein